MILPFAPLPLRFLIAWFLFTLGPGLAITASLTRALDPLRRIVVALGVGTALTPALIDVLGRLDAIPLFPYLAAALAGAGAMLWRFPTSNERSRTSRADLIACAALVGVALTLGSIVFWHRLDTTGGAIVVYGDYDTADMGYYAAEASEASHTVPPTASYYSGHKLNAAYYPHLVLAMVNRFAAVPILPMYYNFAWPTFLMLTAATGFVLVTALASRTTAVLAVLLILLCGDLSYFAAWFLQHADPNWDFVLWPTNFLSPTMELLHFSTWGPSMPLFLTMIFATVRGLQTGSRGWLTLSGMLLGVLFEFKPFAFLVYMTALGAAFVFSGRDWTSRWRYVTVAVSGVIFAVPSIVGAATLDPGDRRTKLVPDLLMLPERMLIKLDLTQTFADAAARWAPTAALQAPLALAAATVIFLVGGIGIRWMGMPGVWRALRGSVRRRQVHASARRPELQIGRTAEDISSWRLLAWTVVAGIVVPSVIATEPYNDTLQFHVTALYILWIFVAVALAELLQRRRTAGIAATAAVFALSLPSSLHFVNRKWHDAEREPRVAMTANEAMVAERLRAFDPKTTVVLHDRPLAPSLTTIVAARRIVLGWDVRYSAVGGEERLRDVNRFYASVEGDPEAAFQILRRYSVTHVIVRADDRVHPDVLSRLQPLLRLPDVTLYGVPVAAQ